MGSVVRVFKNGIHISWQARIVRSGLPSFTLCFNTYDEAADWLNEHEEKYIKNHNEYFLRFKRIDALRGRRKKRTGKI